MPRRPVSYHTAVWDPLTLRRCGQHKKKKNASAENFTTKFWLQCLDVFTGMPDYLCPTFCLLPRPSFLLLFSFVLCLRKCWRDVSHGVKLSLPTNDVAAVLIECFEFNRQR